MNLRIRELNLQAMSIVMNGSDPAGDVEQMYIPSEFTKKFAELIVRECSKHIRDRAMRAGGACTIVGEEGLWLAKDVEQHFGVDE